MEGGLGKELGVWGRLKAAMAQVFRTNQDDISHSDAQQALEQAMIADTGDAMRFLIREVFDDFFVYQESTQSGFDGRLIKRPYSINDDQEVTLGEGEEVVRKVTFEPVTNEGKGTKTNKDGDVPVDEKKQIVDGLIANNANQFAEADRDSFMGLDLDFLKKHAPKSNEGGEEGREGDPGANVPTGFRARATSDPKANEGDPGKEPEQPKALEDWLKTVPAEVKSVVTNALDRDKARRDELVAGLKDNEACPFGEDELKAFSVDQLEKLTHALKPSYYGGIPLPRVNKGEDDGPPEAPPVVLAQVKKEGEQ